MPWINTRIIITKLKSPLKGYLGVVKDVLCGQDTASGLKIAIQLVHLDPSAPLKTIVVNYCYDFSYFVLFTYVFYYF